MLNKMKNFYLVNAKYINKYIFAESPDLTKFRKELESENLIEELRKILNFKRKSVLYVKDIPSEIKDKLKFFLKESKIEVKIK